MKAICQNFFHFLCSHYPLVSPFILPFVHFISEFELKTVFHWPPCSLQALISFRILGHCSSPSALTVHQIQEFIVIKYFAFCASVFFCIYSETLLFCFQWQFKRQWMYSECFYEMMMISRLIFVRISLIISYVTKLQI